MLNFHACQPNLEIAICVLKQLKNYCVKECKSLYYNKYGAKIHSWSCKIEKSVALLFWLPHFDVVLDCNLSICY